MSELSLNYSSCGFEAARSLTGVGLHGHSFRLNALSADVLDLSPVATAFDYSDLNAVLSDTDDMALLNHIETLLPQARELHLQGAPGQGCYLTPEGKGVWLHDRFEAAHFLPNVPEGHKCGRLHGHGFQVRFFAASSDVAASQQLNELWQAQKHALHQGYLNKIAGLENPTSEVLAQWLWEKMKPDFEPLEMLVVQETATAGCAYDGQLHRIWKQQDAECALYVPAADQPFGHSYTVKLHLQGSLDDVMGWTIDYGDVKRLFKPVYEQLDHHCINDLLSGEPTLEKLAKWLKGELAGVLPALYRLDLYETPCCGIVYEWQSPVASVPRLML